MAQYYIKKLAYQELGSPKADGKLSRGRYIYITKNFGDFFPHLSKTVNNDAVVIPVVPFFSNTKVYSCFVYHNDKHNLANGTRDEYRLYLNRGLDIDIETNKRIYQADDFVVFERLFQDENQLMPIYFMYRFRNFFTLQWNCFMSRHALGIRQGIHYHQ